DGIVTFSSASFKGHNTQYNRIYSPYNHTRIAKGNDGIADSVFNDLKNDLLNNTMSLIAIIPGDILDFGAIQVLNTSNSSVQIYNSGSEDLLISDLYIEGTNSDQFRITNLPSSLFSIPVGKSQVFNIAFEPTSAGEKSAILKVNSSAQNLGPVAEINIIAVATQEPLKTIDFSPTYMWYFGSVAVDSSVQKSFIIENTSDSEVEISNILIDGVDQNQFAIISPSYQSFTIPVGITQEIVIEFIPTSEGIKEASLSISNNTDNEGPLKTISLIGEGSPPQTSILGISSEISYNFGNVMVSSIIDQPFIISNYGSLNLSITDLAISGLNADQFEIVSPERKYFEILPGSEQEVVIRFRPTSEGSKSGLLSISNNSVNVGPVKTISLIGIGLPIPPLVSTSKISSITETSATGGGNVTSDGGATVTARGVCWNTSSTPTISNSKTTNGTGTGTFTSAITGLSSNTTYYVRAYAANGEGTSYGNQETFTTLQSGTAPALEYYSHEIDDDLVTSSGDSDGLAEPSESIEMPLTLINTGTSDANNVSAILSTADPYITITDTSVNFGTIIAGSIDRAADFDFIVASNCPEKDVTFTLEISSDEGS
ncbi:MAG: choice-of-anchor D domain-containing protein, partial [Bacteroidales bacterium]|nr:choice-of-anchor D domain-containing protein [Bacteroidales bacterium]